MTTKDNTKTLLTIKVDKKIKKAAQKTAEEIGIPLGTFMNMILKKFAYDKEINFVGGYTASSSLSRSLRKAETEFARKKFDGPLSLVQLRNKWKLD